jgi:WD40 repeat protein
MSQHRLAALLTLLLLVPAGQTADTPAKDRYGDPLPTGAVARAGTLRWRHGGALTFLAFLPDGKTVVSAGTDGKLCFRELTSGRELRRLDMGSPQRDGPGGRPPRGGGFGFGFGLQSLALSPDGKRLAWSTGATVRIWDVAANKELARPPDVRGRVAALTFSADSKTLAGLEGDGTIRLWDATAGRPLRSWEGPRSDPGPGPRGRPGRGGRGGPGGPSVNPTLLFAPDGKTLLTVQGGGFARGRESRTPPVIHLWDTETGKVSREIKLDTKVAGLVTTVFSPDGKTLACGVRDGEGDTGVRLLETATGREVKKLLSGSLTALLFTADGKKLLGWSMPRRQLTVWDVGGKGEKVIALGSGGGFRTRARPSLSADGKLLALPWTQTVIGVLDLGTGKWKVAPAGHDQGVTALAFAAGGKELLTWSINHDCRRWEPSTGRQGDALQLPEVNRPTFAPDGQTLAQLGDKALMVVQLGPQGPVRREIAVQDPDSCRFTFSPDGKRLAVLNTEERSIRLYDVATLKEVRALAPPRPKGEDDESGPEVSPFFSPDGQLIAAPTHQRTLALWDIASGAVLWEAPLRSARFRGGVFTADGRTVALDLEDTVLLLERMTGKIRQRLDNPRPGPRRGGRYPGRFGYGSPGAADRQLLAAAPDGRTLAQAGSRNQVLLWDVYSTSDPLELTGHTGRVRSLLFTPDGKRLASGSDDTTALIWDVARLDGRLRPDTVGLTERETQVAWDDLGGEAGRAFAAICRLARDPKHSVPLLAARLRPVPVVVPGQIDRWIEGLDHRRFAVRQRARTELEKLGATAIPALKKATASPSAEVRKVAGELLSLASLPALSAENLRTVRSIEVLERAGTAEARAVLKKLAAGAAGAVITAEAQSALARLPR